MIGNANNGVINMDTTMIILNMLKEMKIENIARNLEITFFKMSRGKGPRDGRRRGEGEVKY